MKKATSKPTKIAKPAPNPPAGNTFSEKTGVMLARGEKGAREQAQLDAGAKPHWRWIWICAQDARTCASCDALHGEERTLAAWGSLVPGSPELTCGSNCRCERVPINPGP